MCIRDSRWTARSLLFVVVEPREVRREPVSYTHLPRRPLVVFTPKSMLRLKAALSMPQDFTTGTFRPVLPDSRVLSDGNAVTRVLLCSGKVCLLYTSSCV